MLIISFHIHMQPYCTIYTLFRKNHHDFVKFYMVHIWGQILASLGKLGQFLRQVSIYKESYDGLRRVCGGLRRSLAIYGKSQQSMARYDSMVKDVEINLSCTINACHMKTRLDGFWRPTNQNFIFRPFILRLKNNKYRSAWWLKPTNSHDLTALTCYTNYRSCPL